MKKKTEKVNLNDLNPSERVRERLSDELYQAAKWVFETSPEHKTNTFEKFIDGFLRDADPASEISIYYHLTHMYLKYAKGKDLSDKQQINSYSFLVILTINFPGENPTFEDDEKLTAAEKLELFQTFRGYKGPEG